MGTSVLEAVSAVRKGEYMRQRKEVRARSQTTKAGGVKLTSVATSTKELDLRLQVT
jgi:hypothetical protein